MERPRNLSKSGWRLVAAGAALFSLAVSVPLVALFHGSLPLWLHLPLALVLMGLFGSSALLAGVAYLNSRWGPPTCP